MLRSKHRSGCNISSSSITEEVTRSRSHLYSMPLDNKNNRAADAVKTGTSTLGNAFGGLSKAVGGTVGAAGRGVGDTINNTTGTKAVGDGLQSLTGGVEDGANSVGKGVENAGQGKKSW
nr:hypothetical protein B0A51_01353 [Rachicladosporium sp. CCFEE 5018]